MGSQSDPPSPQLRLDGPDIKAFLPLLFLGMLSSTVYTFEAESDILYQYSAPNSTPTPTHPHFGSDGMTAVKKVF